MLRTSESSLHSTHFSAIAEDVSVNKVVIETTDRLTYQNTQLFSFEGVVQTAVQFANYEI